MIAAADEKDDDEEEQEVAIAAAADFLEAWSHQTDTHIGLGAYVTCLESLPELTPVCMV